jgi:hypothetical protein
MPGLDPGIHTPPLEVLSVAIGYCPTAWMAGSSPAMTVKFIDA